MIDFKLPSLGSDMDEGTLLQWNVAIGQAVKKGDVLAVVDTTKAAIDVECWHEGVVHELITIVGQKIPVGTVMARLLAPGEVLTEPIAVAGGARPTAAAAATPVAPAVPATRGVPVGVSPAATEPLHVARPVQAAAPGSRQRASPAARQRAAELGIDLARVAGTGPEGALTLADVEQAAPRAAKPAAPTAADRAAEMRKSIAAAMARSKREIPHYYLSETVPMAKALAWLRVANAQRPVTARLLPAALLLKAVALAVHDYPEMNGFYADAKFAPSPAAHIGVAISLRQGGLVAPALHDVATKGLETLMRDLSDLVKRCRAGSLRSSEMSDPTITVTNLGDQGVESVFGVIYPPQVALVGFGRVTERPWVEAGAVTVMPVLSASLSADHRVSDGHRGALFLARLRDLLQRPEDF